MNAALRKKPIITGRDGASRSPSRRRRAPTPERLARITERALKDVRGELRSVVTRRLGAVIGEVTSTRDDGAIALRVLGAGELVIPREDIVAATGVNVSPERLGEVIERQRERLGKDGRR